jgi:hypothetical protein
MMRRDFQWPQFILEANMQTAISRRSLILATLLAGTAWSGLAQAKPLSFTVPLSGSDQVPPVQTAGQGTAHITYNPATRVVTWDITYSGLASPATMAHFHRAPQGKNGPIVVWLTKPGKPAPNPIKGRAKLTAAQAKQFLAGDWYINIHTKNHPAGALRGQVMPPKG